VRGVFFVVFGLASVVASSAFAQEPAAPDDAPEPRLPVAQAERPVTLTGDTIRIDTGVTIERQESPNQTFGVLRGGAAGGLGDFFDIGSLFAPVQVAPESRWLDPNVYARLRYFESVVELAFEVDWRIPVVPGSAIALAVASPVRWHVIPEVRLDLAPRVGAELHATPISEVTIPLTVTISPTPTIFTGARVGLAIEDGARAFLEASAFFGGTLVGPDGPTADIRAEIFFPSVTDGFLTLVVALYAELFLFP
jgi:hypothetical protein